MNINPTILTSREMYLVGGNQSWKQSLYRGYNVSLEWFIGSRSYEPMLVIWPVRGERDSGAWGICLSSIGAYCEFDSQGNVTGTPTAYARAEATIAIREMFDRPPLDAEVNTLLDVVMRFVPDLIVGVPPPPLELLRSGRAPLFDVVRLQDGKPVAEVSI